MTSAAPLATDTLESPVQIPHHYASVHHGRSPAYLDEIVQLANSRSARTILRNSARISDYDEPMTLGVTKQMVICVLLRWSYRLEPTFSAHPLCNRT